LGGHPQQKPAAALGGYSRTTPWISTRRSWKPSAISFSRERVAELSPWIETGPAPRRRPRKRPPHSRHGASHTHQAVLLQLRVQVPRLHPDRPRIVLHEEQAVDRIGVGDRALQFHPGPASTWRRLNSPMLRFAYHAPAPRSPSRIRSGTPQSRGARQEQPEGLTQSPPSSRDRAPA